MKNFIEVWGQSGWKKFSNLSTLSPGDVFRVLSEASVGAAMIATDITFDGRGWVMKSKLLNEKHTLVCDACDSNFDKESHDGDDCPSCGGRLLAASDASLRKKILVKQSKAQNRKGVFH